ncbi:Multicopper oxidase [Acidisarcina polymorpha]|uniref:Multicopper oxidase n=1 Tax=Acidisarcina polymorpha TaxID=2211140 RepID=A0A2Z5FSJ2_9BACT|nr:Multicopper oxidase [Acidisarcina polymorpha]
MYTDSTGAAQEAPTLEVNPGDKLIIHFYNDLTAPAAADAAAHVMKGMKMAAAPGAAASPADSACSATTVTSTSTNIHFHGTNAAPVCHQDEVVHTLIQPQQEFDYTVQIPADEPPGAYWYHSHAHGFSDPQLTGGASGVIIVQGIENVNPIVAGLPERVFVMRDQYLPASEANAAGAPKTDLSINYVPVLFPSYTPAVIQTLPAEKEFWRVLNTSADTLLDLEVLVNNVAQPLQIVSVDGVPLTDSSGNPTTTTVTSYAMSPASRIEFVVTTPVVGATAQLVTETWNNGPSGDADPGRPIANIVSSTSAPSAVPAIKRLPAQTRAQTVTRFAAINATTPVTQRTLYFSVKSDFTEFYITPDGQTPTVFRMDGPPNITVTEGTVEQWTIENRSTMDHNFHIHQLHFQTLAVNGVAVNDLTRRDTVDVPHWSGKASDPYPSVTLLMDFRDPNIVGTFVYHCHILSHEDLGMMGMIQVLPGATTTTLTASPANTSAGTTVTLTATVAPSAGNGTPTGTVTFQNGATTLGTGTLNSAGVATLTTTALPIGGNSITAVYSGDSSFAASTATAVAITITAAATTTTLTASPTSVQFGANVTLTATVTAPAGTGTLAGSVTFLNGSTTLATVPLNAAGVATFSTTALPPGSASITATYAGNSAFASSTSAPVTVPVQAATTTTLAASPTSLSFGGNVTLTSTVTAPAGAGTVSGSVAFLNGSTTLGTAPLNSAGVATLSITSLPPGSAALTAAYAGNSAFASSTSAPVTVAVQAAATTTTLSASPTTALFGASVAFTATVAAPAGAGIPSGSVTFLNGVTALGTAPLNGSGVATFSTTTLPVGSASITAAYAGGGNFGASTSTAIPVTITAPPPADFSVAAAPTTLTMAPGGTGMSTVTISPLNGFNSAVTFACTGLPTASTCTFSPASVTPNGTAAITTTVTINTTAASAKVLPLLPSNSGPLYALVLPGIGALLGLGRLRRRLPAPLQRTAIATAALALGLGIGACGSGATMSSPQNGGTPAGTSTVTVTATSGATAHTAALTLTIAH